MRNSFNSHRNQGKKRFSSKRSVISKDEFLRAIKSLDMQKTNNTQVEIAPIIKNNFSDFALSKQLLDNILSKGYKAPTPIQDKTIPLILQGKDVIGIANTGTGKTAAFLIPLIEKILKERQEKVLIVAPTRELASQIQEELRGFVRGLGITSVLLIGGVSLGRQKMELKQSPSFAIGTPGRIKDLIQERNLSLSIFNTVVLDETDRMVDIGFIADIKYFISLLPRVRQSLFFSATVSGKVSEVLQSFIHSGITVSVKQQETSVNISQDIVKLEPGYRKIDKLHDLLGQEGFDKVLIFGRTKWGVQNLTNELIRRGFRAGAIHGNKNQNQRQRVLDQFKKNEIRVLLATDVASRGLDIPDVSHVINYDLPATLDDYTHRIGRTGRANKKGSALTFVE